MAPHAMETILRPPQWSSAFSKFVTWCLMWDPRNRPTSAEAMQHEYFLDAVDPLRPRSSTSRILNKKHMSVDGKPQRESTDSSTSTTKSSWFRKSLIKDSYPVTSSQSSEQPKEAPLPQQSLSPRPAPIHAKTDASESSHTGRFRPFANKRATWTNGTAPSAPPMPILPSIRPISPFSATVNAQAHNSDASKVKTTIPRQIQEAKPGKKIGRQLSIQSQSNHYADLHRQDAERALNGQKLPQSPSEQKEGFFSHLRKRARRFSGKPQGVTLPGAEDAEINVGCSPWQSNRNSMIIDSNMDTILKKSFSDVDKVLQSAAHGAQPLSPSPEPVPSHQLVPCASTTDVTFQTYPSLSKSASTPTLDSSSALNGNGGPIASRTRRALHKSTHPGPIYDTPDEEDELLQEALNSAQSARQNMERRSRIEDQHYQKARSTVNTTPPSKLSTNNSAALNPYPTPSPSAKRDGVLLDQSIMNEPVSSLNMSKSGPQNDVNPRWPTPPYEENEWAASAAASIFAAGSVF